jgi:DMSO/TMAO reductase YedYZ molybdopterin-dependent catalytic subunit
MTELDREMSRRTRRSLLTGGIASLAGLGGLTWLATREKENQIPWPLRRGLSLNEKISRVIFSEKRLAPEFSANQAVAEVRINSDIGMIDDFDAEKWTIAVDGLDRPTATVPLSDIKAMTKTEHVTELKCVEGWSQVVHWGGTRFADFAKEFPPAPGMNYVGMSTADRKYYIGVDLASAMQPQTLLCYEMSGGPLEDEHGAPLRLCIPTKYGIKNIKQVAKIFYSKERPPDYWHERGYDWYAGL